MSRVVLLGDSSVGKSSLLSTFVDGNADSHQYSTIGADLRKKTVMVDGQSLTLEVWDTSGQLQYKTLATKYLSAADAVLIVYDLTNIDSFAHVNDWLDSVTIGAPSTITVVVVGNKLDLKDARRVMPKHIKPMQKAKGVPFLEASAKHPETVAQVFRLLVTAMHPARPMGDILDDTRPIGDEESLRTRPRSTFARLCCYCCCKRQRDTNREALMTAP